MNAFDGVVSRHDWERLPSRVERNVDVGALITAGSPTDNTAVAPTSVSGAANGLFEIAQELTALSDWPTIPQLFVGGELLGGCDIVTEMYESGELAQAVV